MLAQLAILPFHLAESALFSLRIHFSFHRFLVFIASRAESGFVSVFLYVKGEGKIPFFQVFVRKKGELDWACCQILGVVEDFLPILLREFQWRHPAEGLCIAPSLEG